VIVEDRRSLVRMAAGLEFLVLDELHTYRGRQGADVALLVRRVREACGTPNLQCIGTSATMSNEGGVAERRKIVASVATLSGLTRPSASDSSTCCPKSSAKPRALSLTHDP
jgi:ATP-dependent helicase YprA (DUF1998 family)